MPIGKNSINRVAAGLDSENAAPMAAEIPSVEIEKTIVEGTAATAEPTPAAEEKTVEKKPTAKKPAAKKPATKKPAAKKPVAKKPAEEKPAEEAAPAVAPELIGQSVAAPALKKRGRKPGSKNKKKPVAAAKPAARKANRIPRAPETAQAFLTVSIGEDLPVYLL